MIIRTLTLFTLFLIRFNSFAQYEFLSPIPNSYHHPIESTIIFRNGDLINNASLSKGNLFSIVGSVSGNHNANIFLSSDEKTVIIDPVLNFAINEKVNVEIKNIVKLNGDTIDKLSFEFYTTKVSPNKKNTFSEDYFLDTLFNISRNNNKFYDETPSTFPKITTTAYDNPDEGFIFFYNTSSLASNYDRFISVINHGNKPFYFKQDNSRGLSFTKQKNNQYSYFNPFNNNFYVLDSMFNLVDSFACGNGYIANYHDFQLLPNENSYLLSYDLQIVDMRDIFANGDSAAEVSGTIIQQLDKNKNVIFQWRSWDNFKITDVLHYSDITLHYFAYVHTNSIDIDNEGNIMFSNYLTDEVTKINGKTGEFIWRLGGNNNQFTFLNDSLRFTCQHDVRKLPNGHITMYDNGTFRSPFTSMAKEYEIDEENKTIKLIWAFSHPNNFNCPRLGNVQRLPNGNTLINWGLRGESDPSITEVKPDSTIAHEIKFNDSRHLLYRAYKFYVNDSINGLEKVKNLSTRNFCYPNPASDYTNIDFYSENRQTISISIYDYMGKLIFKNDNISAQKGKNTIQIDVKKFLNGIYLYRFSTDSKMNKLFIQR